MKQNWVAVPLGQLCQIEIGKTPARSNDSYWDTEKATTNVWLSIADLLNGENNIVSDSKEYISTEGAKISKIVEAGTLLVSFKLTLGRLAFAGRDLFTNEAIAALKIKNEKQISKKFLFYFLSYFDWQAAAEGDIKIKGKTLNKSKLNGINIQFPTSIYEQQHIVDILDEIFDVIDKAKENAENNLQKTQELYESYLRKVFANSGDQWEEKKLGNITVVQSGGTPLKHKKEYWDGDIAWYSSGELNDLYTKPPKRNITGTGLDNSNAKIFPKGSLLIGMYDTAALKMSILDRDAAFNQAIAGAKPNDEIDLIFVMHAINAIKPAILNERRGVRQKNLSLEKIKNISISLPVLSEQKLIVENLISINEEINRLKFIYQKKLAALDELKKSVLQKAFSGELTGA